ncbi:MAG TPA: phosphoglucosamine mutase [Candidatus Saccharimonadales bacterium]
MSRRVFGTDGIRGLAGEYPLDEAGAKRVGQAVGKHFAQPGQAVVIASDPRESSAGLVKALTAGLNSVGVNVTLAGVLPTPGLAYVTRDGDFAAGVMVTASHNLYQYNGIKVFDADGGKLSDDTEAELNKLIEAGTDEHDQGSSTTDEQLVKSYEDFLVNSAGDLKLDSLALAVDTANGAASGLAERVFSRLGAQVTPLFDKPNGQNINAACGTTDTTAVSKAVLDGKLNLGIAVDGDADRVALIDDQGREVNGDHLLYILAVAGGFDGVVATVMSNLGLEQALERHNIKLVRTAVGDRYVLEGLEQTGLRLGGEQSGHIIFTDLLKTGDGLLAAVQAMRVASPIGKSLAQWRDEVELLPQALVNIPVKDKARLEADDVQAFIKQQTEQLGERGRLLIRPSGTEPIARVMVEAPNAQAAAEAIAKELKELLA